MSGFAGKSSHDRCRATIALVGSAFLIALRVLTLNEAWQVVNADTIAFLLSIMVVNANLILCRFFCVGTGWTKRKTSTQLG
jgi:Na+/H+ antiporter NhaD/arsenite permease-like protein